jgi:hypothetical protein
LTGTSGGARNLILGSGCQIDKPYLINNGLADTVTVKNTTGTGIAVPAGKTMWVYNNGTNVVDAVTHLTSLTLGSALPIASGGTGSTSTQFVDLTTNVTGDLPFANLAQGSALSVLGVTGNATADVASIAAGTDNQILRRSGTSVGFGAVNLASSDAVTGALAVTNGGTGGTSQSTARTGLGATTLGANIFTITNPSAITFPRFNADNTVSSLSAADFRTAIGAGTGGGTVTSVGGTGTVNGITLTGTVTSSGNLTLGGTLSGVNLTTQVTGILPVANGGTNNAFFTVSGPATTAKTYTFPNENMSVGYRNIPAVADKTSSYSLTTADVGKVVGVGSGGSITIPNSTFAAGDAVLIFNNTAGDVTITCTITTAYIAGADADVASVTLSTRGVCNILFLSGTACVLTGNIA